MKRSYLVLGKIQDVDEEKIKKCPKGIHWCLKEHKFCWQCGYVISGSCPKCQEAIPIEDVISYCPNCGTPLEGKRRL